MSSRQHPPLTSPNDIPISSESELNSEIIDFEEPALKETMSPIPIRDISNYSINSTHECEICTTPFPINECISLHCGHKYCMECTESYIRMGPPSARITFNHLYCPFRCGSSFSDCHEVLTHPILRDLVQEQVSLLNQIELLAGQIQLKSSSKLSIDEANSKSWEIYSFYRCRNCLVVFQGVKACCGDAQSENDSNQYCSHCENTKIEAQSSPHMPGTRKPIGLSIFKRTKFYATELTTQADKIPIDICDSDDNALAQAGELEVMTSIYNNEIVILTPPPLKAGDPCASFEMSIPAPDTNLLINCIKCTDKAKNSETLEEAASSNSLYFTPGTLVTLTRHYPTCNFFGGRCEQTKCPTVRCSVHGPLRPGSDDYAEVNYQVTPSTLVYLNNQSYYENSEPLVNVKVKSGPYKDSFFSYPVSKLIEKHAVDQTQILIHVTDRLASQLKLVFHFPSGYPDKKSLIVSLKTGDLGMNELDTYMKSELFKKLQDIINSNKGQPCSFEVVRAASEWLLSVATWASTFLEREAKLKEQRKQADLALQAEQSLIALFYHKSRGPKNDRLSVMIKSHYLARMCGQCSFGPVLADNFCVELTSYHGIRLAGNGSRVDNSCPNCGWFAASWKEWPLWDGKLRSKEELQQELILLYGGGSSTADTILSPAEEEKRRERLRRQEKINTNCLIASLRAHARQCGSCGYGPVMKEYCDLLGTHHGENRQGTAISNACPNCGWFVPNWNQWPPWNGAIWCGVKENQTNDNLKLSSSNK